MKKNHYFLLLCLFVGCSIPMKGEKLKTDSDRPRVLVTTDGEIDDECSMIRFMLYCNEWDVEGIITSSSVYHWRGEGHGGPHNWPGDNWLEPYLDAYEKVYPNLVKHDPLYPTPQHLRSVSFLGNVDYKGEMEKVTEGSEHIVKVLLDDTDPRPIWIQAWGGPNTIARALKTIEEKHPERMAEVATKLRFFFIWEQDDSYQKYILPVWGKYDILTIISDQFEAIAYRWEKAQPDHIRPFFEATWMKENILNNHGPLCSIYKAHSNGKFRSEGDSPAFMHQIPVGLRNLDNPDWGGWGGQYTNVRANTWMDCVPIDGYRHPAKWHDKTGWGINALRNKIESTAEQRYTYFKPIWRWAEAFQNDFAARADRCVKPYEQANHEPVVKVKGKLNISTKPGKRIKLDATRSTDPDKDDLTFHWWYYIETSTYKGSVAIDGKDQPCAIVSIPADVKSGDTLHFICEVTDNGSPALTRYARMVITVK